MGKTAELPIFGLSAPSACGKTWLLKGLIDDRVVSGWPSHTTRPIRDGETSTNYDHIFVSDAEFKTLSDCGKFLITATLYSNQYGLTEPGISNLPRMVLLKPQVISRFINTFGSRAVVLGMHSNNGEELAGGLMRERGQTEEDIAERLALYRQEICMNRDLIPDHNYYVSQGHPREIYTSIVQAVQRQGARAVSAAAIY